MFQKKELILLDVVYKITKVWDMVKSITISGRGKQIFPDSEENKWLGVDEEAISSTELVQP